MKSLSITRPDDWHVHLRDGALLQQTVDATASHFARALVMPNLDPALNTIKAIIAYRERIIKALTSPHRFTPFMTLYLNEQIETNTLEKMKQYSFLLGAKLYPAGATTNSAAGVQTLTAIYPLLEILQNDDLVLQIHGEVVEGDIFQRETEFINSCLKPIVRNFPRLRIVLEHISTQAAVEFIEAAPPHVAATITPHHLLYNRNHLLVGGIKPHYYCLPILKREADQRALLRAATRGNPKFFAGTDSAPHPRTTKESHCGCAGIYSAPFAVALYAEIFEQQGALEKLEGFLGHFGADFYRQPRNQAKLHLLKQPQLVPQTLPLGKQIVVPIAAGQILPWSVNELE